MTLMVHEIRGPTPGLACGRTDEKGGREEGDESDSDGKVGKG